MHWGRFRQTVQPLARSRQACSAGCLFHAHSSNPFQLVEYLGMQISSDMDTKRVYHNPDVLSICFYRTQPHCNWNLLASPNMSKGGLNFPRQQAASHHFLVSSREANEEIAWSHLLSIYSSYQGQYELACVCWAECQTGVCLLRSYQGWAWTV